MPDIDLEPTQYRVKRGPIQRLIDATPYLRAASVSGVWAVSVVYFNLYHLHWLDFWSACAVAIAPVIITLILWFRSGGEDQSD